ncbi:uncharacterized protein [Dysidea avara]|uniref:uncharacterized protein n=1 Tax=Dysidea avara TaxID=196820 RepID=UPI003329F4B5
MIFVHNCHKLNQKTFLFTQQSDGWLVSFTKLMNNLFLKVLNSCSETSYLKSPNWFYAMGMEEIHVHLWRMTSGHSSSAINEVQLLVEPLSSTGCQCTTSAVLVSFNGNCFL